MFSGGFLYQKLGGTKKFTQKSACIIAKQLLGLLSYYENAKCAIKSISPFNIFFQDSDPDDLTIKVDNPQLTRLLEETVKDDKKPVDTLVIFYIHKI